ncbi:hypothetical protein NP511_22590 (plasmid) [Natrinema thermotolerans]|uniref:Uncharacterized protein n=2 Tax=Natrinema thermotolerans TaxID=121872 RepID=A0AAF0PFS9_9EURY|nr:hypothetical protein [Natrinema thermotolerans]WMT10356.1 hypothetical protein NP511_22590 [Natrinema thermotolerans]
MSDSTSVGNDEEKRASDAELLEILRRTKEEGIPSLTTAQIDDVGGYDYSNQGLNERLMKLHEEELIGHQKASERHIWWFPDQGTTQEVDLPSLEELIDYEELEPERFSQAKAEEIAEELLPDYGSSNWWQRLYSFGSAMFYFGVVLFALSFALLIVEWVASTSPLVGMLLVVGTTAIMGCVPFIAAGVLGQEAAIRGHVSEEPFEGENLIPYLFRRIYRNIR